MKVQDFLYETNLSQRKFCLIAGISPSLFNKYLRGKRDISVMNARRIVWATNGAVSYGELYSDTMFEDRMFCNFEEELSG